MNNIELVVNNEEKRPPVAKGTKIGVITILFVVFVLTIIVVIKSFFLQQDIDSHTERISEIKNEIKYEKGREESIQSYQDYTHTRTFIEQMARTKLGLVGKDDIVFINVLKDKD